MELEIIEIDNQEYYVLKELQGKTNNYLYLSNVNDENDVFLRKTDINDQDIVVPLESDEELQEATNLLKEFIEQ